MAEGITIQISSDLINQLANDLENSKKKTRKPKPKTSRELQASPAKATKEHLSDDTETSKAASPTGWPLHSPVFIPVTPQAPQPANPAVEQIRSVLQESGQVLERLQRHEDEMLKVVTQRAKQLHEEEFNLPYKKPMLCLTEKDACLACYKEHAEDPLKCADSVKRFKECARMVRLQAASAGQ